MKKYIILMVILISIIQTLQADEPLERFVELSLQVEVLNLDAYSYDLDTFNIAFELLLGEEHLLYSNIDWVLAQIVLESGGGTSELSKTNYNLFGMKKARRRMTFNISNQKGGFSRYKNYFFSLGDYILWFDTNPIRDGEAYGDYLLRRGYASDKNYIKKLRYIKNNKK